MLASQTAMDNRLEGGSMVLSGGGGGKGAPRSGSPGAGGTPTSSGAGSPAGPNRADGTEKGSREADGAGELGALLLLSATSDDLMSISGDMDSLIFREALALADEFANAKENGEEEPPAMAASWQRLSADAGHMAQMLASGVEADPVPAPRPAPEPERHRPPTPGRRRDQAQQRPAPVEPEVIEVPCYRMSEPPPPAEPRRRHRLADSPVAERERAARAASPAYAALCEKASAELRQLEIQTQEEYENLQFEALERSMSAAPRRPPQLTPWDSTRPDSGTYRVNKRRSGTYRVAPSKSERQPMVLDRTFDTETPLDRTFDTEAVLNRTFETEAPLNRTLDIKEPLNQTFDTDAPVNRTFDTEAIMNQTFDRRTSRDRKSDRWTLLNGTFGADGPLNSTFDGHAPAPDVSFDASGGADGSPERELRAPRLSSGAGRRQSRRPEQPPAAAVGLNETFDAGEPSARLSAGGERRSLAAAGRAALNSTFDGGMAPSPLVADADDVDQPRRRAADATVALLHRTADQESLLNRTLDRETLLSRTAAQEALLSESPVPDSGGDTAMARTPAAELSRQSRHGSTPPRTRQPAAPSAEPAARAALRRPAGPLTSTPRRSAGSISSAGLTPISAGRPASPPSDSDGRSPPVVALRAVPAAGRSGLVRLTAHRPGPSPQTNGVRPTDVSNRRRLALAAV
ncbi:hypothetical protein FJT64_008203 [Amphibalanus amphitrite]|uniref:Uncharacterized protein n=1 Tax=Amphibalanus amphitrite TaxID=1232801 RepID=A0A6A4VK86_AMPAM|nr:hypothetical protein FJT64_008203 [Amphibalanus amphitrite]